MFTLRTARAYALRHDMKRSLQQGTQNARFKHSKTQVNRLFKKNPANIRVSSREDSMPKFSQADETQFEAIFSPTMLPNGWSAPPTDPETLEKRGALPFSISRTGNKPKDAIGFLPVYSNVRLGGTKHTTIIRKVSGDREAFMTELKAVLNIPPEDKQSITLRSSGTKFEVNGNRVYEVRGWLAGLGF